MDTNPSILRMIWVTPKYPLGIPDGARIATCSLISHLTRLQVRIDLVCLLPQSEPADEAEAQTTLGVQSCSLIRRSASKWFPLPGWQSPWTLRTFKAANVRGALVKTLDALLGSVKTTQDTFVVFDGLHTLAALDESQLKHLAQRCRGIIYRAHNVETVLWEQCAEKTSIPWSRWFFQYQSRLVGEFERRMAQAVRFVAPVSGEDAARFMRMAPGTPVFVVPIGMDFPEDTQVRPVADADTFELLFIGRLDWLPNRRGLTWFLEKVWPSLIQRRPKTSLKIAGVGDGRWLQRFENIKGIELLGKVDDVEPHYRSCALSIAPLLQGSGTRVKIIEAARFARSSASTTLGAEGSGLVPGQSYFNADTAKAWLDLLSGLSLPDCRTMGLNALKAARGRFDAHVIADQFKTTCLKH